MERRLCVEWPRFIKVNQGTSAPELSRNGRIWNLDSGFLQRINMCI